LSDEIEFCDLCITIILQKGILYKDINNTHNIINIEYRYYIKKKKKKIDNILLKLLFTIIF